MKYLFASLVLSLLVSVGASLPAAAESRAPVREGSAERWSEGLHFKAVHRAPWLHHQRQARASHAKRRYARLAKPLRRHQRTARRPRIARGKMVHHRPAATQRTASAPTNPPAAVGNSVGSDGGKRAGMLGMASYYWQPQTLASGGRFNPNALTAAHKTLPFGTRVRVTHLGNGRSVEVKINDRGPYVAGRIIDLSKAAAGVIGMTAQGVARVAVEILGK